MEPVHSATPSQGAMLDLPLARDRVTQLSRSFAPADNPVLAQLQQSLTGAIAATEAAYERGAPFEECLEKQSHVLWLCNQCDYYTSLANSHLPAAPSAALSATARSRRSHSLWQLKSVFATLVFLKLLNHISRLLPGPTPPAPAWRDLLPAMRLWTAGFDRHE